MTTSLASYLEVVIAAKNQHYFEDFKTGGRLAGDIRKGYQARMAAFNDLAEQGFVKLDSGLMTLGNLSPESWLTEGVLAGEATAWEICDSYPERAKKFKPDLLHLAEIGRQGEEFVISWLRENLPEDLSDQVNHLSLTDDTAGYDISTPTLKIPGRIHLEVKTSTRPESGFTFHLSRNEWSVACRNPNWYLVLVQKINGECRFFGHLDGKSLVHYYPADSHTDFQWTSVKGKLTDDDIFSGLPGF